jgi:hypothetical protein
MTATQVFLLFLREELSPSEYIFFMHHLSRRRRGGKVKPVLEKEFVEKYLCRTNRTFGGFMTRLFVLCPNLLRYGMDNPRYRKIYSGIRPLYFGTNPREEDEYFFKAHVNSKCVSIYRDKWRWFLEKHITSEKKLNSVYKEGETYSYEYIE